MGVLDKDKGELAKQTVTLIDELASTRKPRMSAFSESLTLRSLLLGLVVISWFFVLALATPSFRQKVDPFFLTLVVAALAFLIFLIMQIQTTEYVFEGGRLMLKSGIISKRTRNVELFRVEHIEVTQSMFNRWTGDGVIELSVSEQGDTKKHEVVELIGFSEITELELFTTKLRNLILLLRGNTLIKGIIR